MKPIADEIVERLRPLVGRPLAIARRAADMRGFHFGEVRAVDRGTVGEYTLHVQCPWRLEGPGGIVTGRADLWHPADVNERPDWDTWDYDKDENLQDRRLADFLGGYDPVTRSPVNRTGHLVVEGLDADDCGGLTVRLSGGYRLVLFPAGTRGEDWRFMGPGDLESHFVISSGRVEPPE
jgi:hypothetical protein